MFKIEKHRWHSESLKLQKIAHRVTGWKTECHSLWHFHDINVWENGEWRPARRCLRSRSTDWHLDRWVYWLECLMELCVCSLLLGIMAAHFPVSQSCLPQCLQHVAEWTTYERCHNDACLACALLICSFKDRCKNVAVCVIVRLL